MHFLKILKFFYIFFVLIRFILPLFMTGYIHPDEFFQSSEIVANDIFKVNGLRTWEFENISPMRCILTPYLLSGLPFLILSFTTNLITSKWLLIAPRMYLACLSLIHDWCLYKICKLNRTNPLPYLLILSSSFITQVYYLKTFGNTLESCLISILLYLIIASHKSCLKKHEGIPKHARSIAAVFTFGFFIRPTFILYSFVPLLFWLTQGLSKAKKDATILYKRLYNILPTVLFISGGLLLLDSLYYNNSGGNDIIVTPFNFLKYNLNLSNFNEHGVHSKYIHILVNVPLLFGLLAIEVFGTIYKTLQKRISDFSTNVLIGSVLFSILGFSCIPHQEPRFLIPLLLPFCILGGKGLIINKNKLNFWIIHNVIAVLFFGFVHQGGITPALNFLQEHIQKPDVNQNVTIVFHNTYMPPRFLLFSNDSNVVVQDFAGADIKDFKVNLETIVLNQSKNSSVVYLITSNLNRSIFNSTLHLKSFNTFFPHFSGEALPNLKDIWDKTGSYVNLFYSFREMLSLRVYEVSLMKN